MEYLKRNYPYLRNMGETSKKKKKKRHKKILRIKMWGNLLNPRKIAFFNTIKSEETAKIDKEFMKKDEIFKEKNTSQDTEE